MKTSSRVPISPSRPTFGDKILDVSDAQAETTVNPYGIADDSGRERMTVIARLVVSW